VLRSFSPVFVMGKLWYRAWRGLVLRFLLVSESSFYFDIVPILLQKI
jgi:hypothetical protein